MSPTRLAKAFLAVTAATLALSVPAVAADGGPHAGRAAEPRSVDQARPPAARDVDSATARSRQEDRHQARPEERREDREDREEDREGVRDHDSRAVEVPSAQPSPTPVPAPQAQSRPAPSLPAGVGPLLLVGVGTLTAPHPHPAGHAVLPRRGPAAPPAPGPGFAFPGLGADASTLPLLPAGGPALLGMLMLALSAAWAEVRRRRNRTLGEMLGAQLGVSPRSLDGVPPAVLRRLSSEVAFDELTGVLRRAAGMAAAEREVQRARRSGQPLSLAFVDVDALKTVNDTRGHAAGDELLRHVTRSLKSRLRGQDTVFRYGGDEFVCLLPGTSGPAAARLLEEIRAGLEAGGAGFSVGTSELGPADDTETLVRRADEALYAARGRRRSGA